MHLRLYIFTLIFTFTACDKPTGKKQVSHAIYHWKSSYNPDSSSLKSLKNHKIKKQYIRFFDVDFDEKSLSATPKAVVKFKSKPIHAVVPVVFITNRCFEKLNDKDVQQLGLRILHKIEEMAKKEDLAWQEIQLDCDWSRGTSNKYFKMIEAMRKMVGKEIRFSATIRLHQIKFMEQTGIPPVDRGSLMIYNVGDWKNQETPNSLFDAHIIDQYLDRLPLYPLDLDIALPIFHQTLVYRNRKFWALLKKPQLIDLETNKALQKLEMANQYILKRDSSFYEFSFRKGDVFRFEEANQHELKLICKAILKRLRNKRIEFIYFHLQDGLSSDLENIVLV